MSISERTALKKSNTNISYVEDTSVPLNRKKKIHKFQWCAYAIALSILIMALMLTIGNLFMSTPSIIETPSNFSNITSLMELEIPSQFQSNDDNQIVGAKKLFLDKDELSEAVKVGHEAIKKRVVADASAKSFSFGEISPDIRHRRAVSTTPLAGRIAIAGIGELAASNYIETARKSKGMDSAVGAFFDGMWNLTGISSCSETENAQLISCESKSKYRNINGSCNRPQNQGAAFTRFQRLLPSVYANGIDTPRHAKSGKPLPSARKISLQVHGPSPSSNPSFTVMTAVFGQFLDHDITATAISQINNTSLACCPPNPSHPECFPVDVGPGDPFYDKTGSTCMEFVRSAPAQQCRIGPREQLNQVTAFIDGSVIYGSDENTSNSLREFKFGRLKMFKTPDGRSLLPLSTDPYDGCNRDKERQRGRYCFISGDARANENLHLTTMHLLWARYHNKIANRLAEINPMWSDERLYQETRRIIGAQLQHITYNEFIPIILGETESNRLRLRPLNDNQFRYNLDENTNPSIANSFASAAYRFAHTLLPGLMEITDAYNGTEEYVQLHRMLFNPYSLHAELGIDHSIKAATSNFIQKTSTHVTPELTMHLFEDPLINKKLKNKITPCGLDLVSLNIQRGRDHGLSGYTAWREYCNLSRPVTFNDLRSIMDTDALTEIKKLYESVDDIDLYTGALAEINKSDGIVGPTFTCLIGGQFQRLQQGDTYWYESASQPYPFTKGQLKELRKTSLARLICDCSDGITITQPLVMRSASKTNPTTSCTNIANVDLMMWKE
ncbi:hypothetical protein HCN44_007089 [Aphidius gifuensis]|uniref:Peroxidase n=1 Tax=Aphidius gifuensis TaxID=684658 RepID=A0A834XNZ7_APHGI|nr:chorion peroxidase-like [Aphidius gifuensis]KAF7988779.1 hypothetical protein HCN44_007089 [Aphidius gifuensis]